MLFRPFRVNEAWWAAGGAIALVLARAVSPHDAGAALARGLDVYLFLIGMMALAEFAREEGVFDWIATRAVRAANGSRSRLLLLVYGTGIATTAFLSNDATIVVLTPAVLGAMKRTDAKPHAYVFACALVANAASFVLPIANPSNLLFFADGMPPLGAWFASFGLASIASVVLTYAVLAMLFRRDVAPPLVVNDGIAPPPRAVAAVVLIGSAIVLVTTSSLSGPLGEVAFGLGILAAVISATRERGAPIAIVRGIAWPVVLLTAALFVLVEALDAAGAAALPKALFAWASHQAAPIAQIGIAVASALASNLVNNLPVGLDLGRYVGAAHPPAALSAAALVGVNVGPNLTVNGSLATLLWLAILRRNGIPMTALSFAKIGLVATPAALIAASLLAR
ncbi:MAG: arsenical pump rane protein [Candidatus Eremiobacteraeota bacterium]|nr:arsenical pump rane protein [Candidatus Eremiobacteraeota bacterium]MEA2720048.1 arsenical pump rane protein [Candidatus Eremiobacteraeota bacterium]